MAGRCVRQCTNHASAGSAYANGVEPAAIFTRMRFGDRRFFFYRRVRPACRAKAGLLQVRDSYAISGTAQSLLALRANAASAGSGGMGVDMNMKMSYHKRRTERHSATGAASLGLFVLLMQGLISCIAYESADSPRYRRDERRNLALPARDTAAPQSPDGRVNVRPAMGGAPMPGLHARPALYTREVFQTAQSSEERLNQLIQAHFAVFDAPESPDPCE